MGGIDGSEHKAALDGYARALLEAWVADGRTDSDFAARSGLTRQAVAQIRTGQWGVGMKGLRGIAQALGLRLFDLEANALAWHGAQRPALSSEVLPARGE
jgi:transcriptional regulator with XRE-family HTH domain